MKKINFVLSALFINTLSFAQTAEEVVGNYVKAVGGTEAIAKIKDLTMTMSGEAQGASLEIIIQKKPSNKFIQTVNVSGMGEVSKTVCDGTKAQIGGMQGSQDVTEPAKVKSIAMQAMIVPEAEYVAAGAKLVLVGKEKIGEEEAYKISVEVGETKLTEFYSVASGLKIRQIVTAETPMGSQTITSDYSDYRDVSGVKLPYKMNQDLGMMQLALIASKIEANTNLADALFEIK
jgi:hypothetical protein